MQKGKYKKGRKVIKSSPSTTSLKKKKKSGVLKGPNDLSSLIENNRHLDFYTHAELDICIAES